MKYFICIFTDTDNFILNTNDLYEAMEFYANHRVVEA